jgi:hypothetical protein
MLFDRNQSEVGLTVERQEQNTQRSGEINDCKGVYQMFNVKCFVNFTPPPHPNKLK